MQDARVRGSAASRRQPERAFLSPGFVRDRPAKTAHYRRGLRQGLNWGKIGAPGRRVLLIGIDNRVANAGGKGVARVRIERVRKWTQT